MINIEPVGDRLIVKRMKEEVDKKIGSLYVPEVSKEKPQQGLIIAVGNGKRNDQGVRVPLDVKTGDIVLFGKYSGQDITYEDEQYMIMREEEIFGIVRETKNTEIFTEKELNKIFDEKEN